MTTAAVARHGKTGSGGRPWIELEYPKPPKVNDSYLYWTSPPPETSEACVYWARQIDRGWLPNRRISMHCYDCSAHWYGVYIWEYINVLYPLIESERHGQ